MSTARINPSEMDSNFDSNVGSNVGSLRGTGGIMGSIAKNTIEEEMAFEHVVTDH